MRLSLTNFKSLRKRTKGRGAIAPSQQKHCSHLNIIFDNVIMSRTDFIDRVIEV